MRPKEQIAALRAQMRIPVIAAPMFLVSGPEMVIAAARAGIIGAFPAPNSRSIAELRRWFEAIRDALGDQNLPFAFNMITHSSYGRFDEEMALVSEFRPQIVVTALGGPHRVTDAVHAYGGLVLADVNTPTFARKAVDKGADGLVLVCAGAGGHTGSYAMAPFLDEVRSFFDGPIAVGGGISTGAGILAAETLGADIAYVGTRFLSATETLISDSYRQMVVESALEDIVPSRAITGALGNWMRASLDAAGFTQESIKAEAKIDFSGDMHSGAKAWKTVWSAGQGVGQIKAIEPLAAVVERLAEEYHQAVFRMTARHSPTLSEKVA